MTTLSSIITPTNIVTTTGTNTLTNKTIDGANNTISNVNLGTGVTGTLAQSSLANSSLTVNGVTIALGGSNTVTANAETLTGTSLNSTVVGSSLTSVGTLSSLAVTGNITTTGNISANYFIGNGSQLTDLPSGGIEYVYKTSAYTVTNNQGVLADTTGGAFIVTLPATPTTGDQCVVADAGGVFGTNNLTVARNGSTIAGLAEDLILNINSVSVQFIYDGATWEIYAQLGGNGGSDYVTLNGTQTLTNKTLTTLAVTGVSNLNDVGNITITGGTIGQVLTTDGAGDLSWTTIVPQSQSFIANGNSNVSIATSDGPILMFDGGVAIANISLSQIAIGGNAQSGGGANANTIAIGALAGNLNQGINAIAIGLAAGTTSQPANSIIINATGAPLNGTNSGLYVDPVRNDTGNTTNVIYYNTTSKEVTYGPAAATYGNAEVAAYLPTYTGNLASLTGNVTTTGNISGAYILGNGSALTSLTGANVTGTVASATVAASANAVAGANVTGAVASATVAASANSVAGANVSGQVGNALIAGTVYEAAQPNITSVGTLTALEVTGNVLLDNANIGNLVVTGTTTTANVQDLDVANATIVISSGANALVSNGAGLFIGSEVSTVGSLTYLNASNSWNSSLLFQAPNFTTPGNVTGDYFIGNGSQLTDLPVQSLIANGTSNVSIAAVDGNILMTVNSIAVANITSSQIAIGANAGNGTQSSDTIAIGVSAGNDQQGALAVAIGSTAGQIVQSIEAVAVGQGAGYDNQGEAAVALGSAAGQNFQGANSVAIGRQAGSGSQGTYSVAIGDSAGSSTQGGNSVAIGYFAGQLAQGANAVAIGDNAGATTQGANAVAIGAYAGQSQQGADSIIINATGSDLSNGDPGLYIAPVRNDTANTAEIVTYNTTSKEFTYSNTISVSGNITAGNVSTTAITTTGAANLNSLSVVTSASVTNNLSVDGNISGGNMTITGNVTVGGNINLTGNITQISGNSGTFFGNTTTGFGALYAGRTGATVVPTSVIQASADANDYVQINFQNINAAAASSADYVLTADNGNDTTYYLDMGITSSTWDGTQTNSLGNALAPNDGYLYVQNGNLVTGTRTAGKAFKINVGGPNVANLTATFNAPGTTSTNTTSGALVLAGGIGASGNINAANLTTSGNVTGAQIIGNGSQLSALNAGNVSTGTLAVARGGTGITASGTAGNVLTSDGTGWISAAASLTATSTATLTNKTINLTNNTLIANSDQIAAAVTDETGTGSLVFNTTPVMTGARVTVSALGTLGTGTTTIDLATAQVFTATITASATVTFAFSNAPAAGQSEIIIMRLTNAGGGIIAWPASTKFAGGIPPAFTLSGVDVIGIYYDVTTTTYMVFTIGLDVKA
jgi:hypothetical protein